MFQKINKYVTGTEYCGGGTTSTAMPVSGLDWSCKTHDNMSGVFAHPKRDLGFYNSLSSQKKQLPWWGTLAHDFFYYKTLPTRMASYVFNNEYKGSMKRKFGKTGQEYYTKRGHLVHPDPGPPMHNNKRPKVYLKRNISKRVAVPSYSVYNKGQNWSMFRKRNPGSKGSIKRYVGNVNRWKSKYYKFNGEWIPHKRRYYYKKKFYKGS